MSSEKTSQSVCAVMVTYHPDARTIDNIDKVFAQVQGLVVVDNGSAAEEISLLRATSQRLGYQFIENGENLGIAKGLNQGVLWAKRQGYHWVILFDQDSTVTHGFMDHMLAAWRSHAEPHLVASIHPRYVDRERGTEPLIRRSRDGGPVTSWTSGALMPSWIFDRIGLFASEYFVDCVDHEYCYRIRAAGYLIADSQQAVLLHSPGHPSSVRLLGLSFRPGNHSPMRRYYMSRNRLSLYRKYFRRFPGWVLQSVNDDFRETLKCFLGERDRARKFRYFLLGTWDGLIGRMGKREGL